MRRELGPHGFPIRTAMFRSYAMSLADKVTAKNLGTKEEPLHVRDVAMYFFKDDGLLRMPAIRDHDDTPPCGCQYEEVSS